MSPQVPYFRAVGAEQRESDAQQTWLVTSAFSSERRAGQRGRRDAPIRYDPSNSCSRRYSSPLSPHTSRLNSPITASTSAALV